MDSTQRSKDIHEKIVDFIESGRPFAVALVLEAEGSTPRKAGVKAVIDQTGKIWGTLGGGAVEAEAQRCAVKACQSQQAIAFDFQLQGANSTGDTPICGGMMRVLVDPAARDYEACFSQVAEAVRRRQRGVMLTTARHTTDTKVVYQWFPQQTIPSNAAFPGAQNIRSCLDRESVQLFTEDSQEPNVRTEVLVEPVIPKPLLLIAGGGHIGQALALQASLVGFDVTVVDERPEFTNPALFPEGIRTYCGNLAKETAALISKDTYVVIVTRGHKLDAEVLEACIHGCAVYIGMIGSKRKVAMMRRHFIESGIAIAEEFDRIFTPIGLDIGAVTVPEIATSITAELIAVRRKGLAHRPNGKAESS